MTGCSADTMKKPHIRSPMPMSLSFHRRREAHAPSTPDSSRWKRRVASRQQEEPVEHRARDEAAGVSPHGAAADVLRVQPLERAGEHLAQEPEEEIEDRGD